MKPHIFREYDIRGIVGQEFAIDEMHDLTRAILTYFKQQHPETTTVAVGMDGRTHSPAIKEHVITALTDSGLNVIDIGVCPTPVLYFSLFNTDCDAGLMITASHNPKEYNGIKICLNKKSVWGKQIQEIRTIFEGKTFYAHTGEKGSVLEQPMVPTYVSWLGEHFSHLKGKKLGAVIDCGNGAAGTVIPLLVKEMQWQDVEVLYPEVDGDFPNHEADPTSYKNMEDVSQALRTNPTLSIGIGLDGDCDRMAPMTKAGYLVPGDELLAIYSKQILASHPNASIVYDIKSSDGLRELIDTYGGKGIVSPCGHSIIKESMIKHNALLAGELSCHFFFSDTYFGYDDGIYAFLRLIDIMVKEDTTLDTLLNDFPEKVSSPEFRIACSEEQKEAIIAGVQKHFEQLNDASLITIDGVRAKLPYGWGLARASNTQAVLCLRFESDTEVGLARVKQNFIEALTPFFDPDILAHEVEL